MLVLSFLDGKSPAPLLHWQSSTFRLLLSDV
jgi:hypothetical protein